MSGRSELLVHLKNWYEPWKIWSILAVSFALLTVTVSNGLWEAFDENTTSSLSGMLGPRLLSLFVFITALGDIYVLLPGTILAAFLFWKREEKPLSALFLLMMGGVVPLYRGFKFLIGRSRPSYPLISISGYSYPSGHAISAVTFYIGVAVFYQFLPDEDRDPKILIFASVLAGLVALSRVFLAVHYPSDVLGGVILGLLWITSFVIIYKRKLWERLSERWGKLSEI